jgi:PfaD family protein
MITATKHKMPIGRWIEGELPPQAGEPALRDALQRVSEPIAVVEKNGGLAFGRGGTVEIGPGSGSLGAADKETFPLLAYVPALHPENLGHAHFKSVHRIRYAYVVGAMANGITSVSMVEAAGRAGLIGFFGSAGLSLPEIEKAIDALQQRLGTLPFGFNLIHSPVEPELEAATVNLYLQKGIRLVSASAYLDLTLPLVYYRLKDIHQTPDGQIVCPNKVIAKVSRVEVARKFFCPAPEKLLRQLVEKRSITPEQAVWAERIPLAESMTAEADSGGHTDNQPAIALLPTILALRNQMAEKFNFKQTLCVGLGGGIATPVSAAAAFALGADFVLTGSINQACPEAGTSDAVRYMLAQASQADVTMAPAADMFEMGVKVQVLKRGTMFPFRAAKLYDIYCRYDSLAEIPPNERESLERDIFRCNFEQEWEQTQTYFRNRDPLQIERAEKDPKHKMALVFRSYLGRSSNWANSGEASRQIDYQIWCGPAMGAFNAWVKDTFLENPNNRKTVTLALNLLLGAAVVTRFNWLRAQGIDMPAGMGQFSPLPLPEVQHILGESV